MNQQTIFGPFFATMLLTLAVWVYMYARRVPFIIANKLGQEQLIEPGALALYLFATRRLDATYVGAAWVFFVFRTLHSLVHCTFNLIKLRFFLYACA